MLPLLPLLMLPFFLLMILLYALEPPTLYRQLAVQ
jgi:hypothetical protein